MTNVISTIISAISGLFGSIFGGLQSVVTASSDALGNLS
ncbi:hypothetical protein COCCU_01135 [Corynebacterium occultum]|uniref:Uncharacterized protein n=1 Tax=Corynebacterium occultum TaxID=2675219 RepID=A0A6B8W461_9CORY|nr:hypothetical protein COCCU_01130 [Corynebacterium occultum]QGU06195.1 hypothetical protein COCCU_01135 [Corynebacterium occultum]